MCTDSPLPNFTCLDYSKLSEFTIDFYSFLVGASVSQCYQCLISRNQVNKVDKIGDNVERAMWETDPLMLWNFLIEHGFPMRINIGGQSPGIMLSLYNEKQAIR